MFHRHWSLVWFRFYLFFSKHLVICDEKFERHTTYKHLRILFIERLWRKPINNWIYKLCFCCCFLSLAKLCNRFLFFALIYWSLLLSNNWNDQFNFLKMVSFCDCGDFLIWSEGQPRCMIVVLHCNKQFKNASS